MSIPQWFAEDASCGPTNPMNGLMKQFTQDRSLQQVIHRFFTFFDNNLINKIIVGLIF
jgi:hypothetical protein